MLKKKYRVNISDLKKLKPIEQKRTPYFSLKVFKGALDFGQVGIVVSKKVSPKASLRNELKRRVVDFFSEALLEKEKGKIFLIIASAKASEIIKDRNAIVEQLQKLI